MRWAAVFAAVAVSDAIWTLWIASVAAHRPIVAGLASAALVLCGAFVTRSYVSDKRYLLPAVLGAYVGTWLSVHHG